MAKKPANRDRRGPRAPIEPPARSTPKTTGDPRRRIYAILDLCFALVYAAAFFWIIPNRLPLAAVQLWSLPVLCSLMAVGSLLGGRNGWWLAVAGAGLILLDTVWLLIRILVSAAFLAGVYGAFGKAASTFALLAAALIIEAVALLPLFQLKYFMTRAGRRAFGLPPVDGARVVS